MRVPITGLRGLVWKLAVQGSVWRGVAPRLSDCQIYQADSVIPTLSNFRTKTASLVVAITGRKETTLDLPAVRVKLDAIKSAAQSKVFVQILPKAI